MKRDIVVSLVLLAGTVALYLSLSLMDDPRAVTFPRVIIIIMGILSALLLLQTLIIGKKADSRGGRPFPFGRFALCFSLMLIYLWVMEWLGFYISSFLFFVAITFVLGMRDLSPKNGAVRVGISALFTAILFFLFNKLLAVQTPMGILF